MSFFYCLMFGIDACVEEFGLLYYRTSLYITDVVRYILCFISDQTWVVDLYKAMFNSLFFSINLN